MTTINPQKKTNIHECKECNYITSSNKDFLKHINTIKHSNNIKNPSTTLKIPFAAFTCKKCEKQYKERTALWRHNKNCNVVKTEKQ